MLKLVLQAGFWCFFRQLQLDGEGLSPEVLSSLQLHLPLVAPQDRALIFSPTQCAKNQTSVAQTSVECNATNLL